MDATPIYSIEWIGKKSNVNRDVPIIWIVGVLASLLAANAGCNRSQPFLTTHQVNGGLPATRPAQPIFGNLFGAAPLPVNDPGMVGAQAAIAARESDLARRLQQLDENNRQLQTQLAQSQQQAQLASDERTLLRRQLQDVTSQLQQTQIASVQAKDQLQGISEQVRNAEASSRLRGGARLTANSSLRGQTEGLKTLGFPVIQDGDVIRMRIPSDQLFQPNTASLTPSATEILDRLAASFKQDFSRQRIGIEGHTDAGPFYGGSFATAQQLSAAQSTAIVEHLQRRNQVPSTQLFSLAHGTNHPLADNQTPTGRSQNRRIEIVVYPDTY